MWHLTGPADRAAPVLLALRLTAVLLLLRAQGPVPVYAAQLAIAALALSVPAALVAAPLWLAAGGLVAVRIAADWPLADNHVYLLAYWCLAIGLALGSGAPATVLGRSARWLLGFAMALAVLWKAVLSPDYVDGRFFRTTLLVDERFEAVVRLSGGMDRQELARHREALTPLGAGAEFLLDDDLVEPDAFRRLALALTWGGLVWELALAVAFLAPLRDGRRRLRHALLLGFCVAVYPIAPVAGFGWLLLALGVSQVPEDERGWGQAYVAAWLWVLAATELPWAAWLADALDRA